MGTIKLDTPACVRAVSKNSSCNSCVEICPTDAITLDNNLPSFVKSSCIDCGACLGVCPTEALSIDGFDATTFFFEFTNSRESLVSCKKNVPCIAALSVEHLVSLAIVSEESPVCDIGHCDSCQIEDPVAGHIESSIEEANFILDALLSGREILSENIAYEPQNREIKDDDQTRRDFFKILKPESIIKSKIEFEKLLNEQSDQLIKHSVESEDALKIRSNAIPNKRRVLFSAIKQLKRPEEYHTIDSSELSFTSIKELDTTTCTNCQMCYRVCPTGALSSNYKMSVIDFDSMLCVKCGLCSDVCEHSSISASLVYDLKELFDPTVKRLAEFNVRKCNECGNYFTYMGGIAECERCKKEESEAKGLWGIID